MRKILLLVVDTDRTTEELARALHAKVVLQVHPVNDHQETAEIIPLEGVLGTVMDIDELAKRNP